MCPEPAPAPGGLCFWHDPDAPKTGADIKGRLEALARSDCSLEGFLLRNADLNDVHLTFGTTHKGVNLAHADLSRADLTDAHMFNVDLRGASLMKAGLNGANLNNARMEDGDLLGAELEGTRLERVVWGPHLYQEWQAARAHYGGDEEGSIRLYSEAEEVYRYLTGITQRISHDTSAGHFYHKAKVMRRMQLPFWSRDRAWSKLVDLLCGYGEASERVIAFSLLVISVSAVLYALLGLRGPAGLIRLSPGAGWADNLIVLWDSFYCSVITFMTVGYGDFVPVGPSRLVATLEGFTGAFSISLFVVVFVRKMMR